MEVHRGTETLPRFRNAVVTIGTFDGVHSGHRRVIDQMKTTAAQEQGETIIITFDPHPRSVVQAAEPMRLINTLEEKIELLSETGIDHLVIIPFTQSFAALSPTDYVEEFLVRFFQPRTIIIGYDHRFGNQRQGNYALLEELGQRFCYRVQQIPAHILDSISVSSTRIRSAIADGEIQAANALLGYPFFFSGSVQEGNRLGRTIGYPTANLWVANPDKLIPSDGVYAVRCRLETDPSQTWPGMMNIGFRPTVDGSGRTMEVNLFAFDQMIYAKVLRVAVNRFLRPEQKFAGLDDLKRQLALDHQRALENY